MNWEIETAGWIWSATLVATIIGCLYTQDQRWWLAVGGGTIFLGFVAVLSIPIRSGRFNAPSFLSAMGITVPLTGFIWRAGDSSTWLIALFCLGFAIAVITGFTDLEKHWQSLVFFRRLSAGYWNR